MMIPTSDAMAPTVATSPEYALLQACLQARWGQADPTHIAERAADDIDWRRFIGMATFHRPGWFFECVAALDVADAFPARVHDWAQEREQGFEIRNRFLLKEMQRVLDVLRQAGIRALPLKGLLLVYQLYGRFAYRLCSDLDLWIPPDTAEQLVQVLTANGYRERRVYDGALHESIRRTLTGQFNLTRLDSFFALDVHTRILPPLNAYAPAFNTLWTRRQQVVVDGVAYPALEATDRLIMLCQQGIKNQWRRLGFLCDVAYLIQRETFDWSAVIERARAVHSARAVALGVYLVHRVVGVPYPPPLQALLAPGDRLHEVANVLIERLPEAHRLGSLPLSQRLQMHLTAQDSLAARARYVGYAVVRRMATPSVPSA